MTKTTAAPAIAAELSAMDAEALEQAAREPTPITAAIPPAPRMPRRLVWQDLPEEYPGFKAQFWVNHPPEVFEGADLDAVDAWRTVFTAVVTGHNGWLDFDGQPYPPATDPAFMQKIPAETVGVLISVYREARTALPNSVVRRGGS